MLRSGDAALLIDPFLSARADLLVRPALLPGSLAAMSAILATHEHRDHLDLPVLPALAAASPDARVVVPAPVVDLVRPLAGDDRAVGAVVDDEIVVGAARIVPVPALHGVTMADAYTFGKERSGGLHRYLGYVIELGGVRVYHAGDTLRYDGQAERLRALRIDIALVPINGRSAEREARGIVGNMGYAEAADLVAEAGIPTLIPMHHDTIDGNTGSVSALAAYAAERHPDLMIIDLPPFSERAWPAARRRAARSFGGTGPSASGRRGWR